MFLCRLIASVALASFVAAAVGAAPAGLPAYGADPQETSVSGLSSGAFMAVQLQVAYSGSIIGAGVIAGGPYYCAANELLYTDICMGQVPFVPPNPFLMVDAAKRFASANQIDPVNNLSKRHIYVFSGTNDSIVRQAAVDATVSFFEALGVKGDHLKYVNTVPAGHAVITPSYGNDCAANAAPYISHCKVGSHGYDQAGAILQHIYGELRSRVDTPAGKVVSFDQRAYAPATTGMDDSGYLYASPNCSAVGVRCKVHVALHGCMQSEKAVGDQFYTDSGYNNWADSNNVIVLYPQINKSETPQNPQGCWDWWGYTGKDYADKSSLQMRAIMAMVERLTQAR